MKNLLWFRLNRNVFQCGRCKASTRFQHGDITGGTPLLCKHCGVEIPKREISGLFTFHAETDEEYIQHILAEELKLQKNDEWEWVRIRKANHLLDCTVIAFAMADSEFRGGIRIIKSQGKREEPDPGKPPPINPVTHRPRGNWIKGW